MEPQNSNSGTAGRKWEFHVCRAAGEPAVDLRYGVNLYPGTKVFRWLVFLNGRTEWIEKYLYLPELLDLPRDCGLLTWDHRGQGASGGISGTIDSYDVYASDAGRIIGLVTQGSPYAVLTHSMGGLIGLYSCLTGVISPERMVLSSPLLGLNSGVVPFQVARTAVKLIHGLGLGSLRLGAGGGFKKESFEGNLLTHSREMFEIVEHTPFPVRNASFRWVSVTQDAIEKVFRPEYINRLSAPTLLLAAGADRVVDVPSIGKWAAAAAPLIKVPVEVVTVKDARHELFAEIPLYRDQAVEKTKRWLEGCLPPVL